MINKLRIFKLPFYIYFKQHRCLRCGKVLDVDEIRKVVSRESPEFNKYASAYDGIVFGDIEVIEDNFLCSKCSFNMHPTTYHRIEKRISKMEQKDDIFDNYSVIKYLYEDGLKNAFSKDWSCKECNEKIHLKYTVLNKKTDGEIYFDSFIQKESNHSEHQLRKLNFECDGCNKKIDINEVKEDSNVIKHRISDKVISIMQIITIVLIVIIYLLVKHFQ